MSAHVRMADGVVMVRPFATSIEHLLAELERVDLMIRARVAQVRQAQTDDEHFRGLYISEQEVDELLRKPLGVPQWLSAGNPGRWDAIAEALARVDADVAMRSDLARRHGVELRLERLQRVFALERFDVDVLLVCLASELDLRYEKLYAYLQDDVTRKRPTVDLMLNLLTPSPAAQLQARRRFADDAPLRRHRLIEAFDDPASPHPTLLSRGLKADERIVAYLFGDDGAIDARLRPFAELLVPGGGLGSLIEHPALPQGLGEITAIASEAPVVHLTGAPGVGRRTLAGALCRDAGRGRLLAVQADRLLADASSVAAMLALIEREARLQDAAVLFEQADAFQVEANQPALRALNQTLQAGATICFLSSQREWDNAAPLGRRYLHVAVPSPDGPRRLRMWQRTLEGRPVEPGVDVAGVAGRFRLTFGQIDEAAATARHLARLRGASALGTADLFDACRSHSNRKLGGLARKIVPRYKWDEIVLPPDCIAQLREICNHMKYRDRVYGDWGFGRKLALGKGLTALFAGPSGTGKTMAADVIAGELGLELYKIDLSSVISKYIGETEKNLSRIFDEAETSNAILFFDEADALFGKRSEVKDSHDRYANIEVGYLLQRMEEYEGIAILATNLRKNMDDAFVRRLHFTIEMPFPDEADRHRIWQGIWPNDTPCDGDLDLATLARRFEMTGGNIRNVALAAAFLAADEGEVVRMRHVMRATQREYQKSGKLLRDHEMAGFQGGR